MTDSNLSPTPEALPPVAGSALPMHVCQACGHEWDNDGWYCAACNTPYRIPNPARKSKPNVQSEP